jgi:septal ring factor EnvC (AmiA/AmiB activator)
MTHKNTWAIFAAAVFLSLPMAACKDTKTLQENEQLKAQVDQLQKDNAQLQSNLDGMTASRNDLAKENETLKAQLKAARKAPARTTKSRRTHRRR